MSEELIFQAAIEIAAPEERDAFLRAACGDNLPLLGSVESLLRHHLLSEGFLESPPTELLRTIADSNGETLRDPIPGDDLSFLQPCDTPGCLGRLGGYEIQGIVGRGGMGIVLRARDPKLDRLVALKVILPGLVSSPSAISRFMKEAKAIAAVRNDHVVTIHAIHDAGPTPYLVMEYVAGENLQQRIDRDGPLPVDEVVRIGCEIAQGLAAAHHRGVVHRDMKPSNILLDAETGRARITDFGLAYDVDDSGVTQTGQLAGTPSYMSPEQANGNRGDQRSDLFSLGGVIYAMCTGRPPFRGTTSLATLRLVCEESAVAANELNSQIPPSINRLLDRLLEKDASRRIGTATEVIELLNRSPDEMVPPTAIAGGVGRHSGAVNGRKFRWPMATALLTLFAGVVFIVTRNGKSTRFEAPDGATVQTNAQGVVEVKTADGPETKEPRRSTRAPVSTTPGDADSKRWEQEVAALAAADQIQAVTDRLKKLNPDFDGELRGQTEDNRVIGLEFQSNGVVSLDPLRALPHLKTLNCSGKGPDDRSELADLSPLSGLRLNVFLGNFSQIEDLAPLQKMPLTELSCAFTRVRDLSPLKGMPLRHLSIHESRVIELIPLRGIPLLSLNISSTAVTDVSPLVDSRLNALFFDNTKVTDLAPIAKLPLEVIHWRGGNPKDPSHRRVIEGITTLTEIDQKTPVEFWNLLDAR